MTEDYINSLNIILQIEKTIQSTLKSLSCNIRDELPNNDPLSKRLISLLNENENYVKKLEDVYYRSCE